MKLSITVGDRQIEIEANSHDQIVALYEQFHHAAIMPKLKESSPVVNVEDQPTQPVAVS